MHELAIADSILSTLAREAESRKLGRVEAVVVRVGALSGVVPEALRFGFEAIRADTAFAATRLEVEWIEVAARCPACATEFPVKDLLFACPRCGSGRIDIVRGNELEIAYLEVDDDGEGASRDQGALRE